ncbi:hypothetical protein DH09_02185 [Bacillaceae bacterium JMAK1]|nr:hypothetical protein DH09_02185 [Bacillaceae bacterium JMAK1]
MITSASNPKIKQIKKLQQKKYRHKEQRFLVEGPHLVEEAIRADRVETLLQSESAKQLAIETAVESLLVSDDVMKAISATKTSQGWMAICKLPEDSLPTDGNLLFIDGVQDPGNLGTIIRTAEAAAVTAIMISEDTVDPYNDKVIRSTQGAIFHIPIVRVDLREQIIAQQQAGKVIIGTAMEGHDYRKLTMESRDFGIIVGNEGAGVSKELLALTDENVTIPIVGQSESLNVAVATAILIYQWSNL